MFGFVYNYVLEKIKEKLESSSDKLLSNAETLNNMIVTVAYWLDKYRQRTMYKLFNQQCLTTLDHEAFLKSVEKEKNDGDKDQNDDENEAPIEINTLSTIDFKISYEDFKLGLLFELKCGFYFNNFEKIILN